MTERPLPEDLERWPTDPFELLGLDRTVDLRDARRAYLRLVRTYKPERHPDAFQKIRAAFEAVESELEWRSRYLSDYDEPDDEDSPAFSPDSNSESDMPTSSPAHTPWQAAEPDSNTDTTQPPTLASAGPSSFDPTTSQPLETPPNCSSLNLTEIWELACSGDRRTAYARLMALRHHPQYSLGAYLRLYWLLVADGELDTERTPCDWLCEGAQSHQLDSSLLELYRREIRRDPAEALRPRCRQLLDVRADTSEITLLLNCRWEAFFCHLSACDQIIEDLTRVRRWFGFDSERAWSALLLTAVGYLQFAESCVTAEKDCGVLLKELEELAKNFNDESYLFDRMDELTYLKRRWRPAGWRDKLPRLWIELIPYGWLNLHAAARSRLLVLMQKMVEQPDESLNYMDYLASENLLAACQLTSLISAHANRREAYWPNRNSEDVTMIAQRFLYPRWTTPYNWFRKELLSLCLHETILPEQIANVVDEMAAERKLEPWGALIYQDVGLRTICLAHSAFLTT